jgi:hypothetical protein
MDKAIFSGHLFKVLIAAVQKFPSIGSFAGSEVVNISVADGKATATTFGTVLSRARVEAEGTLKLIGINERDISSFASICTDTAKVTITPSEKSIVLKSRNREINTPVMEAQQYKMPTLKDTPSIPITKAIAGRVGYLAGVAFNDMSRPELCCVMLTSTGQAVACDQKTLAVLSASKVKHGNTAIPVTLAKALQVDDVLYIGSKETVLKSGIALYSMPSPIQAQKDFPLAQITEVGKQARTEVTAVDGEKLALVISECAVCLASRTEVVASITVAEGKIVLTAKNGGTVFSAPLSPLGVPSQDTVFRVPLDGIQHVLPFLTGKILLSSGRHGELFLGLEDAGWIMFPAWETRKKKKVTK